MNQTIYAQEQIKKIDNLTRQDSLEKYIDTIRDILKKLDTDKKVTVDAYSILSILTSLFGHRTLKKEANQFFNIIIEYINKGTIQFTNKNLDRKYLFKKITKYSIQKITKYSIHIPIFIKKYGYKLFWKNNLSMNVTLRMLVMSTDDKNKILEMFIFIEQYIKCDNYSRLLQQFHRLSQQKNSSTEILKLTKNLIETPNLTSNHMLYMFIILLKQPKEFNNSIIILMKQFVTYIYEANCKKIKEDSRNIIHLIEILVLHEQYDQYVEKLLYILYRLPFPTDIINKFNDLTQEPKFSKYYDYNSPEEELMDDIIIDALYVKYPIDKGMLNIIEKILKVDDICGLWIAHLLLRHNQLELNNLIYKMLIKFTKASIDGHFQGIDTLEMLFPVSKHMFTNYEKYKDHFVEIISRAVTWDDTCPTDKLQYLWSLKFENPKDYDIVVKIIKIILKLEIQSSPKYIIHKLIKVLKDKPEFKDERDQLINKLNKSDK